MSDRQGQPAGIHASIGQEQEEIEIVGSWTTYGDLATLTAMADLIVVAKTTGKESAIAPPKEYQKSFLSSRPFRSP